MSAILFGIINLIAVSDAPKHGAMTSLLRVFGSPLVASSLVSVIPRLPRDPTQKRSRWEWVWGSMLFLYVASLTPIVLWLVASALLHFMSWTAILGAGLGTVSVFAIFLFKGIQWEQAARNPLFGIFGKPQEMHHPFDRLRQMLKREPQN